MKDFFKMISAVAVAAVLFFAPAKAQQIQNANPVVALGACQISSTQLASAVKLSSCVRASFTASAGSNNTQLVVTSVSGIIEIGDQIVSGTGLTVGTIITGQISGTTGGAGTYQLNASNTASSAAVTSGGIPPGATIAFFQADTANVRWRDDGGVPTTAIGSEIVSGTPGLVYQGPLSAWQGIAASGSPVLNISFYK